ADDEEPEVSEHVDAAGVLTPDLYLQVIAPDGRALKSSPNLGDARLLPARSSAAPPFASLYDPVLGKLRCCRVDVPSPRGTFTIAAAGSLRPVEGAVGTLHRLL